MVRDSRLRWPSLIYFDSQVDKAETCVSPARDRGGDDRVTQVGCFNLLERLFQTHQSSNNDMIPRISA
jgi:hypothetical protein